MDVAERVSDGSVTKRIRITVTAKFRVTKRRSWTGSFVWTCDRLLLRLTTRSVFAQEWRARNGIGDPFPRHTANAVSRFSPAEWALLPSAQCALGRLGFRGRKDSFRKNKIQGRPCPMAIVMCKWSLFVTGTVPQSFI